LGLKSLNSEPHESENPGFLRFDTVVWNSQEIKEKNVCSAFKKIYFWGICSLAAIHQSPKNNWIWTGTIVQDGMGL
jgi:hypothetical protein